MMIIIQIQMLIIHLTCIVPNIDDDETAKAAFQSTFTQPNSNILFTRITRCVPAGEVSILEEFVSKVNDDETAKAAFQSTFTQSNSNTSFIDRPLGISQTTKRKQHLVVDDTDEVIDKYTTYTYNDITNADEDPNKLDKDCILQAEDEADLIKLSGETLKQQPLKQLYKHCNFINTKAEMELELLDKYYKRAMERLNFPEPPSLYKIGIDDPMRKQIYPIQVSEEVIDLFVSLQILLM